MSMINAIIVAELPALRRVDGTAPPFDAATGAVASPATLPKHVLVLPHNDPTRLPKDILSFCFPDVEHLARAPFHFEHTAEEYTFTLTPKDEPRVHGYCRRYRVGAAWLGSRLDLSPYSASDVNAASSAPFFQCICILSERCEQLQQVGVAQHPPPPPPPTPPHTHTHTHTHPHTHTPPPHTHTHTHPHTHTHTPTTHTHTLREGGGLHQLETSILPYYFRPYHRLFSQCLQLLHAARLAGGPVAMRLARLLLAFENPVPGEQRSESFRFFTQKLNFLDACRSDDSSERSIYSCSDSGVASLAKREVASPSLLRSCVLGRASNSTFDSPGCPCIAAPLRVDAV
jgi:hypothetical protein